MLAVVVSEGKGRGMRMVTMLEDVLLDGNTVCVLPINVVSMRAVTIKSHPSRFCGMPV